MNPCEPFIRRPVATSLLMLAVFIIGVICYHLLPQSALPQVDYPTIQVTPMMNTASIRRLVATGRRMNGSHGFMLTALARLEALRR